MNIAEDVTFGNDGHIERFPWAKKFYLSLVIMLVALLGFGLGRLSLAGDKEPVRIEYNSANALSSIENSKLKIENSSVIASKNGRKYHYSYCPGAKQISETNKIVFATPAAAEASGYTLASNCKLR